MKTTLLVFLSLYVLSLQGLLRPRKARRAQRLFKHGGQDAQELTRYNKDAIHQHIRANKGKKAAKKARARSKMNAHDNQLTPLGDITTATDEMWSSCEERTFEQNLDHFASGIGPDGVTSFSQRYYVCGKELYNWEAGNPVFFYFGNEAEVTAYIEYTGFMWEQADEFNALLVFAEHRYYGESMPYGESEIVDDTQKLKYLTTEQALADYADLIDNLQKNAWGYSHEIDMNSYEVGGEPIIGFGGSYGGMLAAWFRMKYPHFVDGVIAGSAPIFGIYGLSPAADPYAFAKTMTYDASTVVGVDSDLCVSNIQKGWSDIGSMAESSEGRAFLGEVFNLCNTPSNAYEAMLTMDIMDESLSYMAMSSYPYASNYISGAVLGTTTGSLPAYPVKSACNDYLVESFHSAEDRVAALGKFNAVFWNSDGENSCLDTSTMWDTYNDYIWDYLYCRSLVMPSGSKGGDDDMLWESLWDVDETVEWCNEEYAIEVDTNGPASRVYGGRSIAKAMSNVVFTNGDMDPWYPGGVLQDESESLVAIMIKDAGHHLDLMFSNSADSQSLKDARAKEVKMMEQWIMYADNDFVRGMCSVENESKSKIKQHPWLSAMSFLI